MNTSNWWVGKLIVTRGCCAASIPVYFLSFLVGFLCFCGWSLSSWGTDDHCQYVPCYNKNVANKVHCGEGIEGVRAAKKLQQ
jgi:hypothetical protein